MIRSLLKSVGIIRRKIARILETKKMKGGISTLSKKKIKDDGVYFVGQNANDVTGSCIFIKYNGKQILLECGLYQNNDYLESYNANSEKFKFKPCEIDYIFVGHTHVDHIGLIPRVVKEGFRGQIITSAATAKLMEPLLLNSAFILQSEANALSFKYKRNYEPIYTTEDVYETLKYIYVYDSKHETHYLDDVVSFKWLNNSHCIGARQLQLMLRDKNGVSNSILYTSDIGSLNTVNHYLENTEIPESFHKITIMESTYGEPGRKNKKTRRFDLEKLSTAIDTVMERNGTIIMPCFSFSRTQEILTNLYELFHETDFKYDIIVDSILTCEICDLYGDLLMDDNLKLWNDVINWKNVKFITEKEDSLACVKSHTPKIVLSSSGFCTNGRILSYLHEYLSDKNSMIVFSGFTGTDNSYLSYRIKNYKENRIIKISGDKVENKADCISLTTFSSHANRDELITYGSKINTEKLVLVHGSTVAKNSLKEDLKNAISKEDKSFKVIAATKDMFISL